MTSIQFASRGTRREALTAFAWVGFFSIAAALGGCLVVGLSNDTDWWRFYTTDWWRLSSMVQLNQVYRVAFINAGISFGLALFAWSAFRLIRPTHPGRNWRIAEVILVPLFWLSLLLVVDVSLCWLIHRSIEEFQATFQPTLR